jgi:hypothetical protein
LPTVCNSPFFDRLTMRGAGSVSVLLIGSSGECIIMVKRHEALRLIEAHEAPLSDGYVLPGFICCLSGVS